MTPEELARAVRRWEYGIANLINIEVERFLMENNANSFTQELAYYKDEYIYVIIPKGARLPIEEAKASCPYFSIADIVRLMPCQ